MESALYSGFVMHKRFLPKAHGFRYPFFMWYLDLDSIDTQPGLGRWFSIDEWALSRFRRTDYLGNPDRPLADCVKDEMNRLTGRKVTGKVFGLLNLRTLGLYFSPVNFYFGFTDRNEPSHMLAEVSNIPWNERHHYAHLLSGGDTELVNEKNFKGSPFNPSRDQTYRWQIEPPGDQISITLGVHDERGHVFEAGLTLQRLPFAINSARRLLLRTPVMTAYMVAAIYWQALKLFVKGIPYQPYVKEKI
ncbi:MAG: DUF1365 domain-containing protein [Desulfobulbaceae bacterium]|nr:MAG: DUF1365 domain-containing protein [Desulfobulbaceae bacterium]